jgi:hypothetical protein
MLTDGLRLVEGSRIENAAIATGTSFPSSPDPGELFFRTTDNKFFVYNGTTWTEVGAGASELVTVPNGGTGLSSLTANNVILGAGTSTPTFVAPGATGNVLTSNGTTWTSAPAAGGFNAAQNFTVTGTWTFQNTTTIEETIERANVSGSVFPATYNYELLNGAIQYSTGNATTDMVVNFRGNSGTTLNTLVATNQSITCTFMVTNANPAYYVTGVQVDGTTITSGNIRWAGGTAPTAGNVNSIDVYTFSIIKRGSPNWLVLATITRF